ncbi:hypothetical protein NEMBOFW57_004047 [Staphylotrichum longicolle]|uniref:Uncharacterized protein n=1 Tax=Staphylotrichum longicolle TaxID=669026 RepID=A0AAD4I3U3_9PEZI|nr:hypothetical protein NEMBOFW57_004047 [Staphylotrichum longicolle]
MPGKRTRDDDGEHTALVAKPKEAGNDREHTALAAKRARVANHNLAYMEFVYGTNSDLCEDVIICAPTIGEQQTCYVTENLLDSGFLGHVDPALLAPWQPTASVHHAAAALVV